MGMLNNRFSLASSISETSIVYDLGKPFVIHISNPYSNLINFQSSNLGFYNFAYFRSSLLETSNSNSWFKNGQDQPVKERKGWSITIHDLTGSPVVAASMVTPFVPSPGSDRVNRSNPGTWLILRPGDHTWKPWGRLEAWLESGSRNNIGYCFELLPDAATCYGEAVTLSNSSLSTKMAQIYHRLHWSFTSFNPRKQL
ncbi:hypothetical protein ACSBR1_019523 [Camellia fascicularis]